MHLLSQSELATKAITEVAEHQPDSLPLVIVIVAALVALAMIGVAFRWLLKHHAAQTTQCEATITKVVSENKEAITTATKDLKETVTSLADCFERHVDQERERIDEMRKDDRESRHSMNNATQQALNQLTLAIQSKGLPTHGPST